MLSINNSGPVRMVLLENFGAGPFTAKLGWSNSNNVACLLPRDVAQPMMPGIPKFRKESHPERARDKRRPIFSNLLSYWLETYWFRGWAMEAPRPQAGASRKGNIVYIVPLAGHLPVTRSGSAAHPLSAERLPAIANVKNPLWNSP